MNENAFTLESTVANCRVETLLVICGDIVHDVSSTLTQPWDRIPRVFDHAKTLHRALCSLFQPDTDGTRVSKCGQLSQQTRRLDPMLFQCWSSAIGGGPILKQHWVKSSRLLGCTQVSVYTHPSPSRPITSLQGTYAVNHLHILTCEIAVSRVDSVAKTRALVPSSPAYLISLLLNSTVAWCGVGVVNEMNRALGHLCAHIG